MTEISIETLVEWLGPKGAVTGLEGSDITVSELCELATRCGRSVDEKSKRSDIILDLVNGDSVRIDKSIDELLALSSRDLGNYFRSRMVSNTELLKLLLEFDLRPAPRDRINLVEFAAREISDAGMYRRVARGARRT